MLTKVKVALMIWGLSCVVLAAADRDFGGVVDVIDGDTIDVGETRVRLHGIDAPESWQECQTEFGTGFDCGAAATAHLEKMAQDRTARCVQTDFDGKHKRVVARCTVDSVDIARQMVVDGYALAYRKYSWDYDLEEKQAVTRDAGLHALRMQNPSWVRQTRAAGRMPPDPACRIKGNITKNGKIFHRPGQRDYEKTGINTKKGERWFCSAKEAVAAGWRAARR